MLREEDGTLILARHLPPRFDIAADTKLPPVAPLRLAHQIRQDLWRAFAGVRGFSPVVALRALDDGWRVRAGGRLAGGAPDALVARIADLLEDRRLRQRWLAFAWRQSGPNQ